MIFFSSLSLPFRCLPFSVKTGITANGASHLSSAKLMDRIRKLMFELLCTSCSILVWIVSTHISQEFFSSSANRRLSPTTDGVPHLSRAATPSSQTKRRNKPFIQSLIDCNNRTDVEIKCESPGIGT